ncbi:MAG TPA: putative transporter [Chitinophagaceae bacterium]|nr:putative transporter [Chitinophagales bacterium]HRX92836.1 putative transporter [Chitinophagaceae bacterium]
MAEWLKDLFLNPSIAQSVIMVGLVIAAGIWLGRLKVAGISLGITWVLFAGIIFSYLGLQIDENTNHFLKEFGLILFVYSIGLQVGPGFWSSLRKNAITNNLLALGVVLTGVIITVIFFRISDNSITVMTGVMSGAVTNTPGLAAAQAAANDMHVVGTDKSLITLAYAVAYPFGVFGIIGSLLLLKKIFGVKVEKEQALHRKLAILRSNKPVSVNLVLENRQLIGQPLRKIFELLNAPIVVSRMLHKNEIITPTPDTVLAEDDVLLVVASKQEIEKLNLLVGPPSSVDLRSKSESKLISRYIVVTRSALTHKRLGDYPELHQQDFTFTRLNRAGVEMVPHGDIFLQLGDTIKAVGTESGVSNVAKILGNSLKELEAPDLAPIFMGIVLGVIVGSIPFYFPSMPVAVKIGMAGGPLIVALTLSRFGNIVHLNSYTTHSANMMIRELGISLFLASVGLSSGKNLAIAFENGQGWTWIAMGIAITMIPLLTIGYIAKRYFRKTYFEVCGLLAGASTDPPALAFATKLTGSDIPSVTYATVYPLTMILRIVAAQLLILLLI